MENIIFELTNEQRKYLGLIPVDKNWELVKLNDMYLYFDGDIIRKKISVDKSSYFEQELLEKTAENRTILLPKTTKGKPKKLNFTATQSFSPFGVYFNFSKSGYVSIANYTTQTTYPSENFEKEVDLTELNIWIEKWIKETTDTDLLEIEAFKFAERKYQKFKEGDFFAFKISRRKWAYGRILMDVAKLKKSDDFKKQKHYSLKNLMGKPLIVKIYHKIGDTTKIDLEELSKAMALPSDAMMDNHFYYGQKLIIGHKPLTTEEYDMLISYSKSINSDDKGIVYLQYGLIYKETDITKFNKYLSVENSKVYSGYSENPYRNEGVGFGTNIDNLEQCIIKESNLPFWNAENYSSKYDLRNPANTKIKQEIFNVFGLDSDKNYEQNLMLTE